LPLLMSTPAMAGSYVPVHVAPVHIAPVHVAPVVHVNPAIRAPAIHATPAVRPIIVKPTLAARPAHHHRVVQTTLPVAVYNTTQKQKCAPAKPGDKDCAKK